MTIGELDRYIALEYPTFTVNTYGESVKDVEWTEEFAVWAKVEWKGGSEGEDSDKITATTFVNFYIRYLGMDSFLNGANAPTMSYRVAWQSEATGSIKYYYLQAVEQIEGRKSFLKIITKEKD